MSHRTKVEMISDQEIHINGTKINVHEILSILVDSLGCITDVVIEGKGWLKLDEQSTRSEG